MACERCERERSRGQAERTRADAIQVDLENTQTQNLALLRQLDAARRELERAAEQDPHSAQVRDVLDHWKVAMNKNNQTLTPLDGARAKAVRARLKQGYTVGRLKRAIDGCAGSDWHMGDNPQRRRYDDIVKICASEAEVERFEALAAGAAQVRQRVGLAMMSAARDTIAELRDAVDVQRRMLAAQDAFINRVLDELNEAERRRLRVVA